METARYRKGMRTSGLKSLKVAGRRTSVDHAEGAGCSLTSTTKESNEQAQQRILADRRLTVDELAYSLQNSHNSAN